MKGILNIAGYCFTTLENLESLRASLTACGRRGAITGTILLAEEGINLMLAGGEEEIRCMLADIRAHPPLRDFRARVSWSPTRPFKRLRVRVKREIVALKRPDIRPDRTPAPRLKAAELKQWIDQGREFVLLDTRNRFEVEMGTFHSARHLGLRAFSELPGALLSADQDLREELRSKPVVTFCTGGIRCEKAAPLMRELGIHEVYQLDGGILAYFEQCGNAHFAGHCFVFDERIGLDAALAPLGSRPGPVARAGR